MKTFLRKLTENLSDNLSENKSENHEKATKRIANDLVSALSEPWLKSPGQDYVDSKMIILWLLLAKLYRIPIPGHLLVTLIQFASQHDNIWLKELGYIAYRQIIEKNSDYQIMMVNTLRKDIVSSNDIILSEAIKSCAQPLIEDLETIADTFPKIHKACLGDSITGTSAPLSAVITVLSLCNKLESELEDSKIITEGLIKRCLVNKDPTMIMVALHQLRYEIMQQVDRTKYLKLIPALLHIYRQIFLGNLSKSYCYHGMDAPWIQCELLNTFQILSAGAHSLSYDNHKQVLEATFMAIDRAKDKVDSSLAVIYHGLRAALQFHLSAGLNSSEEDTGTNLKKCIQDVLRQFMKFENLNIRYFVCTILQLILDYDRSLVAEQEVYLVQNLEHYHDIALGFETIMILCKLANTQNYSKYLDESLKFIENWVVENKIYQFSIVGILPSIVDMCQKCAQTSTEFSQSIVRVIKTCMNVDCTGLLRSLSQIIVEYCSLDLNDELVKLIVDNQFSSFTGLLLELWENFCFRTVSSNAALLKRIGVVTRLENIVPSAYVERYRSITSKLIENINSEELRKRVHGSIAVRWHFLDSKKPEESIAEPLPPDESYTPRKLKLTDYAYVEK